MTEIVSRLHESYKLIQQFCTKNSKPHPKVMLVVKRQSIESIKIAYNQNHFLFGENIALDLVEKASKLPKDIQWVFIGHLQTNKCRLVLSVPNLMRINSVDSISLIDKLNSTCASLNRTVDILLQVKNPDQESKHGFFIEDIPTIVDHIENLNDKQLNLMGFMCLGYMNNNENTRRLFNATKQLMHRVNAMNISKPLSILSYGMSNDLEIAIEEDTTEVRIGRAVFGER